MTEYTHSLVQLFHSAREGARARPFAHNCTQLAVVHGRNISHDKYNELQKRLDILSAATIVCHTFLSLEATKISAAWFIIPASGTEHNRNVGGH